MALLMSRSSSGPASSGRGWEGGISARFSTRPYKESDLTRDENSSTSLDPILSATLHGHTMLICVH